MPYKTFSGTTNLKVVLIAWHCVRTCTHTLMREGRLWTISTPLSQETHVLALHWPCLTETLVKSLTLPRPLVTLL